MKEKKAKVEGEGEGRKPKMTAEQKAVLAACKSFDGTETAPKKRGDLEKMNDFLRNRLRKISDVADKAVMGIRTDEEHNIALLGACTEIRQLVDFHNPRENPVDLTAPEMKKENKFGFLANGVQMIRFASGKMVTLIGKRERGPHERQGGRTDKIIYKVTLSRESKTAAVDIDGVNKINLISNRNELLERGALAMLNCIIRFNKKSNRHKRANYKRRKAAAAAAKQGGEGVPTSQKEGK